MSDGHKCVPLCKLREVHQKLKQRNRDTLGAAYAVEYQEKKFLSGGGPIPLAWSLADLLIRADALALEYNIDLEEAVRQRMNYFVSLDEGLEKQFF